MPSVPIPPLRAARARPIGIQGAGTPMRGWFSQIIIGVIVTVIGTVLADAVIKGMGGRGLFGGGHYSGPFRSGR